MQNKIALFGEAERAPFNRALLCHNLFQLFHKIAPLPSSESPSLSLAIQSLLFGQSILFFRVEEEGQSISDYRAGFNLLADLESYGQIDALCLPGVGDPEILAAAKPILLLHHAILLIGEQERYDYLSSLI